ncbi:MAG TPA: XrtA system polysaccharide deacetylase [Gemmatimonadaceae bacterium]|nr:XrtA system polysaccharide deacetylase [Gemmatimonadaceae bacterium]
MLENTQRPPAVTHVLTVDVEEYFQVGAFEQVIPRRDWDRWPSRARPSVERLLDLFARHEVKATCFVLGWFAKRHPELVRAIAADGHEIASHGWSHRSLTMLSHKEFRDELRMSKAQLEHVTGTPVVGFRAPNFSIVPGAEWAFDVLLDEGYLYDSSLFVHRKRSGSGYPAAYPAAHEILRANGRIMELPIAARGWIGVAVPASGGAYFRYLPYPVTRDAFTRLSRGGTPGVFYIHPWELDAEQPRVPAPLTTRLRHYTGIRRAAPRLERLLSDFAFTSVRRHPTLGFTQRAASESDAALASAAR